MRRLNKVRDWYDTIYSVTQHPLLYEVFTPCAAFNSIYLPVKTPTANGMPNEFTYTNIGLTTGQLAETYDQLFGANFLVEPITTEGGYAVCMSKLASRIEAVYRLNLHKYLKLIELQGYTYNPLWNVDGVEEYTYLENNGVNDISVSKTIGAYTDTRGSTETTSESHEDTNSVTSFDSTDFNDTDHNEGSSSETTTTTGDSISHGSHTDSDSTTVTHHNALNGESEYSGGTDTFGNTVIGGDKYHNERKVRQGNIGVTKTQELIAAERENLKFSVIMEFFKDINEQILVGIY